MLTGVKIPGNSESFNGVTRTNPPDPGGIQASIAPDNLSWTGNSSHDWDTPANWSPGIVPGSNSDILIGLTAINMPTLSTDAPCKDLTLESGATLLGNSHLDIHGVTRIKRLIPGNWNGGTPGNSTRFHYVASPLSATTASVFQGNLLNKYDEPSNSWQGITNPATLLHPGEGYSVAMATPGKEVVFSGGSPNSGDQAFTNLSYTQPGSNQYIGWHLLGNPFPSALDWDLGDWARNNVDATVYTWDATTGNYRCWPALSGFGTMTDGIIPPEQGFMVHVSGTGTGSITIPEAARVHGSQPLYKSTVSDLLGLEIKNSNLTDKMFIHFREEATNGFDPDFDAFKLMGDDSSPQLYSILPDLNLTINVLPTDQKEKVIPIGLKVGKTGEYQVSASGISSFEVGTTIFLEDIKTGRFDHLNNDSLITISASPGDLEHRFNIHFNPVNVHEVKDKTVAIYTDGSMLFVNISFNEDGVLQVYDLPGKELFSNILNGNSLNRISMENFPYGYYIVKLKLAETIKVAKVCIRSH